MPDDGGAADVHREAVNSFLVALLDINDFVVPKGDGDSPFAFAKCRLETLECLKVNFEIVQIPFFGEGVLQAAPIPPMFT
jgi:hypothetical protein